MLTDAKVSMIQQLKGTAAMSIQFIKDFDREWDAAVARLRDSGADLNKIMLIEKNVEYKNVRT